MGAATPTALGDPTPLGEPARFGGGLTEVAPGTFAWLQPNGGLGESNAGIVVGAGESLLIDTLWDVPLTRSMLAAAEEHTEAAGAPILTLLNTHGDGDHWYGNGLLPERVEILATAAATAQMRAEPPSMLTRLAPLGALTGVAARVPLFPGRDHLGGLADFAGMLGAYDFGAAPAPRLPGRSFTGAIELHAGGRLVEVIEVGPAHTAGDAIAWLPDERVLFAGDIVFNGITPIMWAGPVNNWIGALERIQELDPAVVVGGHGPAAGAEEVPPLISDLLAYWRELRERVADAQSPTALAAELVGSAEYRSAPWGSWANPERTLVNAARIAATDAGGSSEIGTLERLRLIAQMGALARRDTRPVAG